MKKITDGMRFRTLELMAEKFGILTLVPDELRKQLDEAIETLENKNPEAYTKIVKPKPGFGNPDWEHQVEVDPWDLLSFNTYFNWSQRTIGFGQYSISVKREGDEVVVSASTETMSVEWQRHALHGMIEGLFAHIPEDLDIESLPEGKFRIKVPDNVLAHEKKLHQMMTAGSEDTPAATGGNEE